MDDVLRSKVPDTVGAEHEATEIARTKDVDNEIFTSFLQQISSFRCQLAKSSACYTEQVPKVSRDIGHLICKFTW